MALTMNDIYEILKNEGGRTPSEKVMEVSKDHPDKVALRYKAVSYTHLRAHET